MKKIFPLLAFYLLTISSITTAQSINRDTLHLQYGKAKQQALDLYLPKSYTTSTPVLIMLHGGAWVMGGNEYTEKTSKDLRDRGFIVANVDYRYVNDSTHAKDLLNDIDSALRYLQHKATQYSFTTINYHIAGISAGAHLALLYAFTTTQKIKSISVLCPPIQLDDTTALQFFASKGLTHNLELLANAKLITGSIPGKEFADVSPHTFIKNIPTLIFHGDADDLVPDYHARFLYKKLKEKNYPSAFHSMKGKGHDAGMNSPDTEKFILDTIEKWIADHN